MIKNEDIFCVGRIGKPHGTAGETTIQLITNSFDEIISPYIIINVEGILVPFFINNYKIKNHTSVLITLEDINTAEKIKEFTGCEVFLPRIKGKKQIENTTTPEIIGYKIKDNNTNKIIGEIVDINTSTINFLFEVNINKEKTLLIPAAEELITNINSNELIIEMNIPEGLLHI